MALLEQARIRTLVFGSLIAPDVADRLVVETNPRARRLGLRVEPARDCIVLVRPKRATDKMVKAFIADHLTWIRKHLDELPSRVPFADGSIIPFRDVEHLIVARPESKGGVWRENKTIVVTGRAEHASRRVTDWLKKEAREQLVPLVNEMATKVGRVATHITLRDTRTRWGSCAQGGKLSFSWRLVFAPDFVLTYVAAHEVAHLVHANHGPAFKRVVAELLRPHNVTMTSARKWLRGSGTNLHRYG